MLRSRSLTRISQFGHIFENRPVQLYEQFGKLQNSYYSTFRSWKFRRRIEYFPKYRPRFIVLRLRFVQRRVSGRISGQIASNEKSILRPNMAV